MKNRFKILIVDDDPEFTESVQETFEHEAYDVAVGINRAQAQEAAQRQKPDAVLLGTITPRRDAFLLHKWFRETPQFSDMPMVVIDAPRETQFLKGWRRDDALQMVAEDYLAKPLRPESLIPVVEKMLEKSPSKITVSATLDHALIFGKLINQSEHDESLKSKIVKEVEEILRSVTTPQDLAEIEKVIAEAKGKLKLEPKGGFWEDKTPCWELTHCEDKIRNECPAYAHQTLPCWKIEGTYCKLDIHGARGDDTSICQTCRVYSKYGIGQPIGTELEGRALIDARFSSTDPF